MKKVLSILFGVIVLSAFAGTIYYLHSKSEETPVVYETAEPAVRTIVKNVMILIPIVFGLIGLLLVHGVIASWFGSWWIEVTSHSLIISRRIFGIGRTRILQTEDIRDIEPKANNQFGNLIYYAIKVRTADGKTHTAGDFVAGKTAADAIIERMRTAMEGR